jgi:alpha-L-arabinofuranosidase
MRFDSHHSLLKWVRISVLVPCLLLQASCGLEAQEQHYRNVGVAVNKPESYPVTVSSQTLNCTIDVQAHLGVINKRLYGTNLEWFNDAGGLSSPDLNLREKITALTKAQGAKVMRFPGGTLADFYHWKDGIGPQNQRQKKHHPTDPGISENQFGSPEFFNFLKTTDSEGLITVNAGTGTAEEAAEWVAYANQPQHLQRMADGVQAPANIRLWEIGNELYLPGNPGEQKITVTPEVYAQRYLAFSRAMKAVDPSITTIAIATAKSHIGPDTEFQNWAEVLLKQAASEIDMVAVHNAYFPIMLTETQPHVKDVYPSLWASPEAVDRSLIKLENLIKQYETTKKIGIAVTEWGALFSFPFHDHYWIDHVKTMGSGVYVARMMQVFASHPRVEMANYFKLSDRSFMGWINYEGHPKVPFWILALYAKFTGDMRIQASIDSPHYDSHAIGIMQAEKQVPVVTVLASRDTKNQKLYVNIVNRSMDTSYPIHLHVKGGDVNQQATQYKVEAKEMTAHNGRDIPPELPYKPEYEPYSTAPENSIKIQSHTVDITKPFSIAPFSVMTLELDMATSNTIAHNKDYQ